MKLEKSMTVPVDARCTRCGASAFAHPSVGVSTAGVSTCDTFEFPRTSLGEDWYFWCPGCECYHSFRTKIAEGQEKRKDGTPTPTWSMTTDKMGRATFNPSLLIQYQSPSGERFKCHLFLRDDRLHFCDDSTHALRGKSVDLSEMP